MTESKKTVEKYMEGFRRSDHQMILDCLTDDVVWKMPGVYTHRGKEAFDKEIENDNFVGSPTIQVKRLVEENDIVIAQFRDMFQRRFRMSIGVVFLVHLYPHRSSYLFRCAASSLKL